MYKIKKDIQIIFPEDVNIGLNPEPDDDSEVVLPSGDTTKLSTYKKKLEALQRVEATYTVPVANDEFEAWRATTENYIPGMIGPHTAVKRLEANPILEEQFMKLMSGAISYNDFWERYLFRVALLQDCLAAVTRKEPIESVTADPVLINLHLQSPI